MLTLTKSRSKHKEVTDESVHVFFNDHKTFDCYTIVTSDGNVYGCSDNPFLPNGFGQFSFHVSDITKTKQEYISMIQNDTDWLGKEINDLTDLPIEVQNFIKEINE